MHLIYGVCHELQLLQKHRAACSLSLKIAHYKKRERAGGCRYYVFLSLTSSLFFFYLALCFWVILWRPPESASSQLPPTTHTHTHTSLCWTVSKVITGRLLHAFMKYSNGSMSYCALIMPHKDTKDAGGQICRQQTIMKEHLIYWDVDKKIINPLPRLKSN